MHHISSTATQQNQLAFLSTLKTSAQVLGSLITRLLFLKPTMKSSIVALDWVAYASVLALPMTTSAYPQANLNQTYLSVSIQPPGDSTLYLTCAIRISLTGR